ncbi:MAG: pilus assembly protein TadG-related protein [Chloroflexi bacterium]|nr:pilus assembly protein TadG-related protein [Chloroflexota bacterium]
MTSPITRLLQQIKISVRRLCAQEHGVAAIYVALALPVLLGFAALAIDGSNLYAQQGRMQTAADAAALAGAQRLAQGDTTTQVQSVVQTLATANGANSVSVSYLNSNTEVQVTAVHTFATFFAGVIGYPTFSVQATAKAHFAAVTSAGNLLPMTVMCDDMDTDADAGFTYGATYVLHDSAMTAPGNRGWLTWNGSPSASTLADNITHPSNSPVLKIGDWMNATTGTNNSSGVRSALDGWINKAVTIPLYNTVTGNGSNARYRVCAFAEFVLLSYANKTVTGKFIRSVAHDTSTSNSSPPDFGVRDVRMTQ